MTKNNFEHIKSLNVDEFAQWLLDNGKIESGEWEKWFDREYCQNCESTILNGEKEIKEKLGIDSLFFDKSIICNYCEINKKCKYFPHLDDIPNGLDIIKFWLQKEYKEK